MHIDNKGTDRLIFRKGTIQRLAEEKYPINITQSGKRFVLSLHYNGSNSFLFVNATKVYQFKIKNSEIKDYALSQSNTSKHFTINNMKNQDYMELLNFFLLILILLILTIFQISINI